MKNYLILLTLLSSQYIFFQEVTLDGKYSMHFEEAYKAQNGIINFSKDTYKRRLLDGREVSGVVDYQKFRILLKDNNANFEMIIVKSSFPNDTIPFGTMDITKKSKPTGDILIHEGKLIKL